MVSTATRWTKSLDFVFHTETFCSRNRSDGRITTSGFLPHMFGGDEKTILRLLVGFKFTKKPLNFSTITAESWHLRGQDGGDRPTANWRENPWTGATGESWIIHQERSQVRYFWYFFISLSAVPFLTAYQYIIVIADPLSQLFVQTCMLDVSVASEMTILWGFPTSFYFPQHRSIIKRVTALEYKLHRLILSKEDFTAYVQVHQHY